MSEVSYGTHTCTTQIGGQEFSISTGVVAKQADGAVIVKLGETVVLATAVMGKPLRPDADFMPLLVEYEEKFYAAGKIKGSRFVKREGRPHDDAILTSRLIDRSIRPLFPKGMINDVQIVVTVLSYDGENDPDVPAMIAACGALMISGIPWEGPLAAARIGRVDGKFIINPTVEERAASDLDVVVAGTGNNLTMLEGGTKEVQEEHILDAIEEAQKAMAKIIEILEELKSKAGKPAKQPTLSARNEEALNEIKAKALPILVENLKNKKTKEEIGGAERTTAETVISSLTEEEKAIKTESIIRQAIHEAHAAYARELTLKESKRVDGRGLDEIRPLNVRIDLLPRTHGSALFQRGETQILTITTLGGPSDVLILDTMEMEAKKRYIHYYNFPAFSVGEIKPARGPGRREIGHGALAERALVPVLPDKESWPYTMLLVSEVLESHGSSSMGSVCGSSLSLMAAGVPIKKAVAGIAMGLMSDDAGTYRVLTDIAGLEDEKGDMDFKVAGTADGVTALQMDIKLTGLNRQILSDALAQAKKARLEILSAMNAVIDKPRTELSPYAPRIETMRIPIEKIGDLIGPKGKHINQIVDETGVEIDIEDDGLVSITAVDPIAMAKAKEWVHNLTREIKAGERFEGRVTRIMDFGAFVELVPNVEGMVHISQFRDERVNRIEDVVKVGDIISVLVVEIDSMGRINLSHKAALPGGNSQPSGGQGKPDRGSRPRSSKPFRGPRPPR
jgi:polyribonucleotide nucleotidyltransferase